MAASYIGPLTTSDEGDVSVADIYGIIVKQEAYLVQQCQCQFIMQMRESKIQVAHMYQPYCIRDLFWIISLSAVCCISSSRVIHLGGGWCLRKFFA